jgi:hypothetical protein
VELSAALEPALRKRADGRGMDLTYDLGPARDLDAARPTIADLQRAQAHALDIGDLRRAAAYALVVRRRIEVAQHLAAA